MTFKRGLVAVEAGLVEQRTWESPEVDPWVNWSRISHAAHGKQPCFKSNSLFNGGLFLAFLSIINHKGKIIKQMDPAEGMKMNVCMLNAVLFLKYYRQKKNCQKVETWKLPVIILTRTCYWIIEMKIF